MDADGERMEPCGLNHHPDGCSHSFGVGGSGRCRDTGRIRSGGPAALLDNTLDPQVTPDWPLTPVVTPNQGSHARADSGEGRRCRPAVPDPERRAAPAISVTQSDTLQRLEAHSVQFLVDRSSSV